MTSKTLYTADPTEQARIMSPFRVLLLEGGKDHTC